MTKNNNANGLQSWLRKNAWAIILIVASGIITFSVLQQRVNALEEKVTQYPSQDWFELKFQNIDERLLSLEEKLENMR